MKVSIIGLGWFGEALALELKDHYEISGTTRSNEKIQKFKQQNISAEKLTISDLPSEELLSANVIILNIPPFSGQLEWLKSWKWNRNVHVVFISSTSVYGRNHGTIEETTTPIPETENAKLLIEEEKWIQTFPNYTIIRFGGLIGHDRHPGNSLSGKINIQGGNLPVNLIHLQDCIGFTKLVFEEKLCGETFNLVHPKHPSRREYYQNYCLKYNLPLPEFIDSADDGKIISNSKVMNHYKILMPIFAEQL